MPHSMIAILRGAAVAGVWTLTAFTVHAQSTGALPPMRGEGNAQYVCGGIGSDESTAMRAAMKSHPLALLFSRPDGAYLADVDVAITASSGAPQLRLRASGPICLIDVPPGRYSVEATAGGATKREEVTLGAGSRTVDFRF